MKTIGAVLTYEYRTTGISGQTMGADGGRRARVFYGSPDEAWEAARDYVSLMIRCRLRVTDVQIITAHEEFLGNPIEAIDV